MVFGPAGCWPRCSRRGVPWYVARDAESAVLQQDVQRPVWSAAAVRDEELGVAHHARRGSLQPDRSAGGYSGRGVLAGWVAEQEGGREGQVSARDDHHAPEKTIKSYKSHRDAAKFDAKFIRESVETD